MNNTTKAFTTSDGVSGVTFTSKKDTLKFIFIPMTGYARDGLVNGVENIVWSNMTEEGRDMYAISF